MHFHAPAKRALPATVVLTGFTYIAGFTPAPAADADIDTSRNPEVGSRSWDS